MVGKIVYISNTLAHIELEEVNSNLMNMHVIFEDNGRKIIGEVEDIDNNKVTIHFLGEIINDKFIAGLIMKPSLNSKIRLITNEELKYLVGSDTENNLFLGYSPLYDNCPIYTDINDLFSNHMAIFGNTGSGKSYGVARLLQNLFEKTKIVPFKSNFFIFDAYGEYHNAFSSIDKYNPNYHFKYYTTNLSDTDGSILRIPLWLLSIDDMALLLQADSHSQIPIIERMLKLVSIFSESSEQAENHKNHLIAKAIMTILYTNQTSTAKRNDIFSILASCSTDKFNLNAPVQGIGYVRKFRECFTIDKDGEFTENILVTEYISSFIHDEYDRYEPGNPNFYTLKDLEKALEFTLISEGLLRNEKMYNEAVTLKVRLHSLVISQNSIYFSYPSYVTLKWYTSSYF